MKLDLFIETHNVGVDPAEDGGMSLSALIHRVAEQVAEGYRQHEVRDFNGNRVGAWVISS